MITDNTNKVLQAIDNDPELLNYFLHGSEAPTRAGGNPFAGSLGGITQQEANTVAQELNDNPVVKLFLASSGALDAKDLVNYVGGVTGRKASDNRAVRALFDGKLDLKEILLIIVLLKLFKRKNANTYSNSAIGLLGSLLGYNTNTNNHGIYHGLYGNSYGNGIFGNNYASGLFGNAYNTNSGLGNFLGLTGSNYSNSGLQNLLNFVNGSYNNNQQYATLYNILNQASGSAVNANGVVNASGLFSVLNQMMGGR